MPKPRPPRPGRARKPPAKPRVRLPSAYGWLASHGWEIRGPGFQLGDFMASDAEFAAFLAAAPQAGRLLRPLCRMLRIEPPAQCRLVPKPRKPRPKRPPREKPEPFRIPIPPGARAWMPKKPRRKFSTA